MERNENDRVWRALLWGGGAAAALLLAWEILDWVLDAGRPAMRANDAWSALGSILMLAVVGVIAARRSQVRRANTASRFERAAAGKAKRKRRRRRT